MKNFIRLIGLSTFLILVSPGFLRAAEVPRFTDLSIHHPNYDAIMGLESQGIVQGYDDRTFGADRPINRAEFTKIMVEQSGLKIEGCLNKYSDMAFFDVNNPEVWYTDYICTARYYQWIDGYPDGSFKPAQNINFAEASKIIANAEGLEVYQDPNLPWYESFGLALESEQLIPPTIYAFDKPITRGDQTEMYNRLIQDGLDSGGLSITVADIKSGTERYMAFNSDNSQNSTWVNIRKDKSGSAPYLEDPYTNDHTLKSNELILAIGSPVGDWQRIRYYDGQEGYIHKDFLKDDPIGDYIIRKMEARIKSHNDYHSTDFKPVRLPRQTCAEKFDWKLVRMTNDQFSMTNSEEMLLGYVASPWNEDRKVYAIEPGYFSFYEQMGGVCSDAGGPLSEREETGSSKGTKGHYQAFEHARIYESSHGTYSVTGDIFKIHENESNDNERGTWSKYGFPTTLARKENGKLVQYFEEGKIEVEAPRLFRTSIADVVVRAQTNPDSDALLTISDIKTDIYVVGDAVQGEYVDAYKTDRWYPVDYDGRRGYVLATLLHPEWIEFDHKLSTSDCGTRYDIVDKPIDRVVLHGTAGSSETGQGAAAAFGYPKDKNGSHYCKGAHFFIGRNGSIVQVRTVDNLVYHAGYGGTSDRVELYQNSIYNSHSSIGVEIANLGLYRDQTIEATEIDQVYNENWQMWKEGLHWGTFPDANNPGSNLDINSKKWQFYTDEQYTTINKLLDYIEESVGIPYKVSKYKDSNDTNNNLGYYYHPLSPKDINNDTASKEYKDQTDVINAFVDNMNDFRGVVDHHYQTGKWDSGAALDICNSNLNFSNMSSYCNSR